MKEALRCFISCIIPCGTLDVVRIVHASGRVEEISGAAAVTAGDVMQAHPNHVLRKPPSASLDGVDAPTAVILPPYAELKRGKIYFLMPLSDKAAAILLHQQQQQHQRAPRKRNNWPKKKELGDHQDQKQTHLPADKAASAQRSRRRGRVGVWRPHLESICEVSAADLSSAP